ncbi:hypothetical protein KPL78_28075 [Roseomonas sp. HJA6]|uniref:Immunity MXAN-0049 protein domain-containing protein n=2 Tax=Roseomonas alba TaxID=2846776 RepID=A0ABS7AHF3_9PROT|nr:hypothetical protein [Neoroseomonas alba]
MGIRRDAYEALCQARDALDAGPPDGPEHTLLHREYLKARLAQYRRAESRRPVVDPVPAMNRRFFTTSTIWDTAEFPTAPPVAWYGSGGGRGWDEVRTLPKPQLRLGVGTSIRRLPPLLNTVVVKGTHILSRPLLEIWQRFDPEALDILPIALEGRRKQPVEQAYFFVDIVRQLPAFDLDAMEVFLFREPRSYGESFELFPAPQVYALREDLPVAGVHLFRDLNWNGAYFISAELRQACLDAGFTDIPLAHPETPDTAIKVDKPAPKRERRGS